MNACRDHLTRNFSIIVLLFFAIRCAVSRVESGGRLAGEQSDLTEASLFQKRDLPVLNDYRSVLSQTLSRMYELSAAQLDKVFPGS